MDGGTYFVTFRLADSLPHVVLASIRTKYSARNGEETRHVERYLDAGAGRCYLRNTQIAKEVAATLGNYDGSRYRLFAWCIMPNHVHVVFQPRLPFDLARIMHTWKSYSANIANQILDRDGRFWQREYYDHLIRNGQQLGRAIRYTAEIPSKRSSRSESPCSLR